MWRDLERVCARQGVAFRRPSSFPRNGLLAARVTCALPDEVVEPFVTRVYRASFADDRDIARPEVITSCLEGLAADPAGVGAGGQRSREGAAAREYR